MGCSGGKLVCICPLASHNSYFKHFKWPLHCQKSFLSPKGNRSSYQFTSIDSSHKLGGKWYQQAKTASKTAFVKDSSKQLWAKVTRSLCSRVGTAQVLWDKKTLTSIDMTLTFSKLHFSPIYFMLRSGVHTDIWNKIRITTKIYPRSCNCWQKNGICLAL